MRAGPARACRLALVAGLTLLLQACASLAPGEGSARPTAQAPAPAATGSVTRPAAPGPVTPPPTSTAPQPALVPPPPARELPAPPASSQGAAPAGRKPGGYYLDDGPEANPPAIDFANLPDAVPEVQPLASGANRPYEALGEVYFPDTSSEPFREQGIATWYGRKFHGHRTSSGERYDMYGMTAAHRTLPIPSFARVTLLATGKSVVVRINDRGPFAKGRILDLSYGAAAKLGLLGKGSGEVVLERVFPGDPVPAAPAAAASPGPDAVATQAATAAPQPGQPAPAALAPAAPTPAAPTVTPAPDATTATAGSWLQLGAYSDEGNARRLAARAQTALQTTIPSDGAPPAVQVLTGTNGNLTLHRVRVGPFANAEAQQRARTTLRDALAIEPRLVSP